MLHRYRVRCEDAPGLPIKKHMMTTTGFIIDREERAAKFKNLIRSYWDGNGDWVPDDKVIPVKVWLDDIMNPQKYGPYPVNAELTFKLFIEYGMTSLLGSSILLREDQVIIAKGEEGVDSEEGPYKFVASPSPVKKSSWTANEALDLVNDALAEYKKCKKAGLLFEPSRWFDERITPKKYSLEQN